MSSQKAKPTRIEIPERRPHLLREYTSSPPEFHTRTPRTATNFPFDKRDPQRTGEGRHKDYGYFSLIKVKGNSSPVPPQYQAHGFIPLCSFGAVEKKNEAKEYFSHPLVEASGESEKDLQPVTAISNPLIEGSGEIGQKLQYATVISSHYAVPYESHGFIPLCSVAVDEKKDEAKDYFSRTLTGVCEESEEESQSVVVVEESIDSDSSTPRLVSRYPEELIHPTGSPVHERDITPTLRGGHEHTIFDTLERLEQSDHIFDKHVQDLEESVLDLGPKPSPSSFASARPGSVESEDTDTKGATEVLEWQDIATTSSLPDSDSSDTSDSRSGDENVSKYRTALSSFAVDSDYHSAVENQKVDSECRSLSSLHSFDDVTPGRSDMNADRNMSASTMKIPLEPTRPSALRRDTPMPNFSSPPVTSKSRTHKLPSPPPNLTMYQYALRTSPKTLVYLLSDPKLDIINSATREIYVSHVPIRMLEFFCGSEILHHLSHNETSLDLPSPQAEKEGIAKVLRFMTRLCRPRSHSSCGDMRIPQGATFLKDGIETVRACRVLNLSPDAERLSRHIVSSLTFTDDIVDTMWSKYDGILRGSVFGDAVVWYILKGMQCEDHGLKEELLSLLEHEEFAELKQRVRVEIKFRMWRNESKEEYLDRWSEERRRKVRKRVRLEREEEERLARVEAIRTQSREERESKEKEKGKGNEMGRNVDGNNEGGWASGGPQVRNSPGSEKALFTPPSDVDSKSRVAKRKPLPDLRSSIMRSASPTRSNEVPRAASSASLPVQQDRPSDAGENPRAAPIPRMKSSLFKRLLKKTFEA
jgi:hypothetical protein